MKSSVLSNRWIALWLEKQVFVLWSWSKHLLKMWMRRSISSRSDLINIMIRVGLIFFNFFCLFLCPSLWFLQHVFPVDFSTDFDSAIRVLMWHFLSRLEHFLPIPDLQQVGRHGQSRILEVVFGDYNLFYWTWSFCIEDTENWNTIFILVSYYNTILWETIHYDLNWFWGVL